MQPESGFYLKKLLVSLIFGVLGLKIIPVSNWTLSNKGAKQVPIVGLDDKREITALLSVASSGDVLPPQLIYKGSTERCHPQIDFPKSWDIHHSPNHWSNESTMLRYIEKIILPYMSKVRTSENQKGLCIFDVFAAHLCDSVLEKLRLNNLLYVTIPAGCTSELQPLDLTVNQFFKSEMKKHFHDHYASQVQKEIEENRAHQPISLQLTVVKPIHARWILDSFATMENKSDLVRSGFRKAGILPLSESEADTEPLSSDNDERSAAVIEIASSDSGEDGVSPNDVAVASTSTSICIVKQF